MDVGPHVGLIALAVGMAFMAHRGHWPLASYFGLTAASVLARDYFSADEIANSLTWVSLGALAAAVVQVWRERDRPAQVSGSLRSDSR
jgi:hypothetical protein